MNTLRAPLEVPNHTDLTVVNNKFGFGDSAETIENSLNIFEEVDALPHGASVLNLGSGVRLDIQATLFLRRPDIFYIGLDGGYTKTANTRGMIADRTDNDMFKYEDMDQVALGVNDAWMRALIGGSAQEIPLVDESVDLVFSHACVPLHVDGDDVLGEIARVLTPGGRAILGPIGVEDAARWEQQVATAVELGLFTPDVETTHNLIVRRAGDAPWHAQTTRLQKPAQQ